MVGVALRGDEQRYSTLNTVTKAVLRHVHFANRRDPVQRHDGTHHGFLRSDGKPEVIGETVVWALPKYALTRICVVEYTKSMQSVFEIIAEPNRRAILGLLVSSQQSVGEIERQLGMTQPTVSKHLRVLREAGFVESTVDAQRRLYQLKPEPFQEVDAWLDGFRRFWSDHVDALERHLDRMDPSTPTRATPTTATQTKRKPRRRRRGPNRGRDKGETK
jgi:DNA-binding transcriptional ArsR family regulator